MKKQLISIILGAAMCVSGFVMPVSAAEDVSAVCTFDGYSGVKDQFTLPENWVEVNGHSDKNKYTGVQLYSKTGLFGKNNDDTVYQTALEWRPNVNYDSLWYQTRYVPNVSVEGRKYVKVSYEMALDYVNAYRWLQLQFKDADNTEKDSAKLFEMNKVNGNYVMSIGGETTDYAISADKWMKFDVVCDLTAKTADLYINGDLKKAEVSLGLPDDYTPAVLNSYIFGVNALKNSAGTNILPSNTYFDNVAYLITDTKPVVDAYAAPDVIDFQSYTGGSVPQGYDYANNRYNDFETASSTSLQKHMAYNGLRGKAASDVSWRVNASNGSDSAAEWTSYRWNTNMNVASSETRYFKFSTEFAMEGAAMTRGIQIKTTHSSGNKDCKIITISKENGEQTVTVGDSTKAVLDLPMSSLMKFDVVIDRTNLTFDLYINGEKKFENIALGADYISDIPQILFMSQQKWESSVVDNGVVKEVNCFVGSDTYYDNMECGKYYAYPEIKPYTSPSVTVMSKAEGTVTPIDPQTFGHWVPLRGYDSKYYYYAENVSMPADNATRVYKATFGKLSDNVTVISTNDNIVEVKNGAVKVYGKDIAATVPTDKKFKLSFLFDILNKTYNVYADDQAIAVDVKFDTNNGSNPITEFSSIENTVTAEGQSAEVSAEPIASGAFTKLPEYAKFYELTNDGTSVTAKVLSSKLSGKMILAVYGSDKTCKSVALGENGEKNIAINKDATDTAKFMFWDDMVPVMNAVEVK